MKYVGRTLADIKIRFNNKYLEAGDPDLKWRLLEDGHEKLARDIRVNVPCWTTHDILPGGIEKWHLSCRGRITWNGESATVEAE